VNAIPRIISGGQTGADRAALDWAIAAGVPHGGWCPRGRRAEDGVIPRRYRQRETPSRAYSQRTRWNVRDSDGAVIISVARVLRGGSALTRRIAIELQKPWLHLSGREALAALAKRLQRFIREHRIKVLNIAGPRASSEPSSYALTYALLSAALGARAAIVRPRPSN